ncbi:MAG: penicillin-binding protein 2, partial [bacterium]|nr:penicillin-binding protein 2 [bacterium]
MPARIRLLVLFILLFASALIARLFYLQVIRHGDYSAQAAGQHALVEELFAKRGTIYMHDYETDALVPVALSQDLGFVYVVPKEIENVQETVDALVNILDLIFDKKKDELKKEASKEVLLVDGVVVEESIPEIHIVGTELDRLIPTKVDEDIVDEVENDGPTEYERFVERLSDKDDPYEPVMRGVLEEQLSLLREKDLPGVYYLREATRLYPEAGIGGHVLGFVGQDSNGFPVGQYGVEGFNDELLSGRAGHLETQKDVAGRLVAVGKRSYVPPEDGSDIILTIDRTIQFTACRELRQAVLRYGADGGSVIIMDPRTGNILAMCGYPDFYPGAYGDVESIDVFNNPATFGSYEPGSIFKSVTMAAALDTEVVTPSSTFVDTGLVEVGIHTIRNSDRKAHGEVTMTEVLEQSLNTGMAYVVGELGYDKFREYVQNFGFGEKIGLPLNKESSGDISSLDKEGDIFAITASFGQGISVTPIQMV